MSAPDSSFDAPLGTDGEGVRTRHDFVASDAGGRPDVKVEEREFHGLLREKLETFAATLTGRDETIFRERWLTDSADRLIVYGSSTGDRVPEGGDRQPNYPESLDGQRKRAGYALLGVRIDSIGRVDERAMDQLAGSEAAFTRAGTMFVRRQQFKPGLRGGRPTAMWTLVQWVWHVGGGDEVQEFVLRR